LLAKTYPLLATALISLFPPTHFITLMILSLS